MTDSTLLDEYLENIVSYLHGDAFTNDWYMEPLTNANYTFSIFYHVPREEIINMVWREFDLVLQAGIDNDSESKCRTVASLMVSVAKVYLLTNSIE